LSMERSPIADILSTAEVWTVQQWQALTVLLVNWWSISAYPTLQQTGNRLTQTTVYLCKTVLISVSIFLSTIPWKAIVELCQEYWAVILCTLLAVLLATYQYLKPSEEERFRRELKSCWKDLCLLCQNTNFAPYLLALGME
jgi:magnesium-transporting ATPase (P-type)